MREWRNLTAADGSNPDFYAQLPMRRGRARTQAWFSEGALPIQYRARIAGFAMYPLRYPLPPEDRRATPMAGLFGGRLCAAAIASMSRACAKRLRVLPKRSAARWQPRPANPSMRPAFASAARRNGWIRCVLILYRGCAKRGDLPANAAGIAVRDAKSPPPRCKACCPPFATRIVSPKPTTIFSCYSCFSCGSQRAT